MIFLYENLKYKKPDPRAFDVFVGLNVAPENILYVGDTTEDYLASHGAGARFIGVMTGLSTRAEFELAGCKEVIHSVGTLPEFIKS
ncbi:MAG: HAD family hydrolase [Candidatus Aenigmarchaeota archaeon]|nr:HAD family hydrolase [Candidatus Aenigmarchaeota archaeon]